MFVVSALTYLPGSHLLLELPDVKTAQLAKLFGARIKHLDSRAKYSESVVVRSEKTKELFSLYMYYGVWRIGGFEGPFLAKRCPIVDPYGKRSSKDLKRLHQYILSGGKT